MQSIGDISLNIGACMAFLIFKHFITINPPLPHLKCLAKYSFENNKYHSRPGIK
jgi:hypothetical protein